MSVDRLLTKVLQMYQDVHDDAQTEQIYSTTTTLLTNLSNPLNLSLLTSQLLVAPAIWHRGHGIRACYRVISIYNTAAIHVARNEQENTRHKGPLKGGGLRSDAWAATVVKGADQLSSRWQHLLVLSGVLMGFEGGGRRSLSKSMRQTLEQAVVTAANLALQARHPEPRAPAGPLVLALNFAFQLLSPPYRSALDCDALAPVATEAMFAADGLQDGLVLGAIDLDVRQTGQQFVWSENTPSFRHMRLLEQKPLVANLGPLSRLIAYSIEHARDPRTVLRALDEQVAFTERLLQRWQANKFSELEPSEEAVFLIPETLQTTWPSLWQLLKKIMYAVVAVLRAAVARSLLDRGLGNDATAPVVATKSLNVLRNVYFISSRDGSDAFQVYTFTYLASIDMLARFPDATASFLQGIRPTSSGSIPAHPLYRTLDLFYLNLAEHLPLYLPPAACDALIVQPAITYLTHAAPHSPRMMELYESAHSAVLSALSCPHNAPITVELVPFYADTLNSSFPSYISPRQFRLAFKTLMQILSPPFPISETHPQLAEGLLEMVRFRSAVASGIPLPPPSDAQAHLEKAEPMSEQSTLVLALIDALPFLHLSTFEDWMTLTAHALNRIEDTTMRDVARRRFWQVLVSGEMDVERSAIGVAWWGTKGGRQAVLFGAPETFTMSGAIPNSGSSARL
ncbi:hypothetical protein B0H63DRAFT_264481 [Podospora didyma]|uniref:Peroxisomal membrane protein PEX17 n=1 Tax=Podospora didyma TaxID=330526 RepID=A0AAE0KFI5_9PEZI|nr:hypothetical protein B0H63DRAFT_264481 [Podospora didyma]